MSAVRTLLEPLEVKSRSTFSLARNNPDCARFFVTNSDLETELRQPPTWRDFGLIELEAVEQYEDNWDLLKF